MRVIWRNVKNPRIDLREGEVVIIAPRGTDINTLLEKKRDWINRTIEKIKSINEKAEREVINNGVRVLDNYYKVIHNCKNVGIFGDTIYVCKKRGNLLKEKLKTLLRDDIETKIAHYSSILNVKPKRVFIREQKTKWGSCSSTHNLSFNLGLIFLPSEFREYVVAHETVHLLYPDHGPNFRKTLLKVNVKLPSKEEDIFYWYYSKICKKRLML